MPEEAVIPASPEPGASESAPEQKVEGVPEDPKRGPDGWIPKVRFNEVLDERNDLRAREAREREERIRLEERLRAQDETRTRETRKAKTPAELDELVSRGELTRGQADEYLHGVTEERAVARALAVSRQALEAERRAERRTVEMQAYTEAIPELRKRGSETWQRLAEAYRDIVFYNGTPTSKDQEATYELMAVRTALGPLSAIRKRQEAEAATRASRETHNEVGNGTQPKTDEGTPDARLSKLSPKQQEYFKRMSNSGRYPGGIKEYLDELNYVPPRL